jgi:hypothetical protein
VANLLKKTAGGFHDNSVGGNMIIKNFKVLPMAGLSMIWLGSQLIRSSLFAELGNQYGWLLALLVVEILCCAFIWLVFNGYGWMYREFLQRR